MCIRDRQVDVAEFEKSIDIPDQNDDFNAIRDEYRTMYVSYTHLRYSADGRSTEKSSAG